MSLRERKILGGGMVGIHAGDMIGEVALAIEMCAVAVDIGKTNHPHPTPGENIGMAAEVAMAAVRMCRLRGSKHQTKIAATAFG